jgi:hypothetical protein
VATKHKKGTVPSGTALRQIRKRLADAATLIRAAEVTKALSNVGFDELLSLTIRELVGDDTDTLRETVTMYDGGKGTSVPVTRAIVYGRVVITKFDRVNALENTVHGIIQQIKKHSPREFEEQMAKKMARTDSGNTGKT